MGCIYLLKNTVKHLSKTFKSLKYSELLAARVLPMAEVNRWFIFIGLHKGLLEDSTEHLHTDQKMTKEGVSPAGHDAPVP